MLERRLKKLRGIPFCVFLSYTEYFEVLLSLPCLTFPKDFGIHGSQRNTSSASLSKHGSLASLASVREKERGGTPRAQSSHVPKTACFFTSTQLHGPTQSPSKLFMKPRPQQYACPGMPEILVSGQQQVDIWPAPRRLRTTVHKYVVQALVA